MPTGKYEAAPKLMELVQHTESDAWLALSLAMHLNLLPLSRQLSCLSGSLWSRTLQACPLPSLLSASHPSRKQLLETKCTGKPQYKTSTCLLIYLHGRVVLDPAFMTTPN